MLTYAAATYQPPFSPEKCLEKLTTSADDPFHAKQELLLPARSTSRHASPPLPELEENNFEWR